MSIFVVAPDIFVGDAVGNHCLSLVRSARRLGWNAHAFAERFSGEVRPLSNLFEEITWQDILFVSYSIYDPFLEKLLAFPGRKICYFHGVTDPELLRKLDPVTAHFCALGVEQLPLLKGFDFLLANSRHTAQSLSPYLDIDRVRVLSPVSLDMPIFERAPVKFKLLFVGRALPHKRLEDAIDLLAQVRAKGCDASLTIVGSLPNAEYSAYLTARSDLLGVRQYVHFAGVVDQETLFSYFDNADALVSFSRHEGFCVPVLEAMHLGLPTFVRAGTAASEIGGNAVVVFENIEQACHEICRMHENEGLRLSMIESGKRRAAEILAMANDAALESILQSVCSTQCLSDKKMPEVLDEQRLVSQDESFIFPNIYSHVDELKHAKSQNQHIASPGSRCKIFFEWAKGFYDLEKAEGGVWRWSQNNSVLSVKNNEKRSICVKVSFTLAINDVVPVEVQLSGSLINENLKVNNAGASFSQVINVPPGVHEIVFSSNAIRILAPGDPRLLFFRVEDFKFE